VDAVPGPQLDAWRPRSQRHQNLKAAFARLQEAEPQHASHARSLSHTSLALRSTRAHFGVLAPISHGQEPTINNFDLEADLSYEVDLGSGTQPP